MISKLIRFTYFLGVICSEMKMFHSILLYKFIKFILKKILALGIIHTFKITKYLGNWDFKLNTYLCVNRAFEKNHVGFLASSLEISRPGPNSPYIYILGGVWYHSTK